MNIFNSFVNNVFPVLRDNIFKPLNIQWSAQDKRIAVIAAVVFAAVTACLLLYSYVIRFKARHAASENNPPKEQTPVKNQSPQSTPIFDQGGPGQPKKDVTGKKREEGQEVAVDRRKFKEIRRDDVDRFQSFQTPITDDEYSLIDGDEFYSFDEETPRRLAQPQVFEINGKFVSLRTIKCLKRLDVELESLGKACGKAIDNGDCFWDSFAKGLSAILGREVTIKELREQVSQEVQRLDQGPEEDNWVKKFMETDLMDVYEDYRDQVAFTCDEILEKGKGSPVWGTEKRDGVILCHLYKVNLKVYSVGCMDDHPSQMENEDNFYFGEDDEYPQRQPYDRTIEIALYPGHFMPVFQIGG